MVTYEHLFDEFHKHYRTGWRFEHNHPGGQAYHDHNRATGEMVIPHDEEDDEDA